MKVLSEEQLKYKPYHNLFRVVSLPLFCLLFVWIHFFKPVNLEILSLILAATIIYSLVTFFILPIKYLGYRKFFIDIVVYTFFILVFVHFSGGAESPFFPLLFLPIIASISCASLSSFFIILIIVLAYYFLVILISAWYNLYFPLEQSLINLFFVAIIGYLCFIVAEQVRRQIETLKEIEKAKSEFISATAHQLRSPLSGTRWIIDSFLEGDVGQVSDKQKEYFNELYKSNEKLRKFLNEVISIYRLEKISPKINFVKINLGKFIEEIILRYSSLIEMKKIKFDFEKKDIEITNDKNLIDLILDNFISNAIRYSLEDSKVTIKIEQKNKFIEVIVKDQGIGIPKDDQQKIFQKFYRAKNALRQETEGSGLGLYLSKKAAESIGGDIWFISEEGKGSTFGFKIPLE